MKLSDERKEWLRKQLDEFKECHLMNFGDSRGWDVHGDLCALLDDNAQLEQQFDFVSALLEKANTGYEQLEEENAALKRLLTSTTCGECDETMLDCTCPDTKSLLTAEESE